MTVAFDANVLMYVLSPNAAAPPDPATGMPVERCADRVNHLLKSLQAQKERVVIPTPALAEVLVHAEAAGPDYVAAFQKSRHFTLADFDARAAVEHAVIQRKRRTDPNAPKSATRAKAKFDDQIVAIAAVSNVTTIYSDDDDVRKLARYLGIDVKGVSELPLPPVDPQGELDFGAAEALEVQAERDIEMLADDEWGKF